MVSLRAYTLGLLSLILHTSLHADYPLASHRYLADPATLVTEDRVYVYCSNDDESPVEGSYNIPNIVCLSSADLKNWTDHGVVFDAKRDTSWAKKTWAPAAIQRDGKTYLYFGNGGSNIGVAVGDTPTGPFRDALGQHLIDANTPGVKPFKDMWLFDPGVFLDDDGQAYLYFGGNGDDNVRFVRLNRDMISLAEEVRRLTVPHFFEAAWVFKRNGLYYFAYSTTPKAEMRIDYLTSTRPDGDFTYRGVIGAQPPLNNNNNHAAQFLFKGQWYHFYHNRSVAHAAGIPTGFRRNLALERLNFNEDGSLQPVTYTEDGLAQIASLNPFLRVEAETFARQQGVETAPLSPGDMMLAALESGDWIQVRGVACADKAARTLTVSARAHGGPATLELRRGDATGPLLATVEIPAASDGTWSEITAPLPTPLTGTLDLTFKVHAPTGTTLDWNHWQFHP